MSLYKVSERPGDWLMRHLDYDCDDYLIWPFWSDKYGYPRFAANDTVYNPRAMVCKHAHGPAPVQTARFGSVVSSCNNRKCLNPKHLSWKVRKLAEIKYPTIRYLPNDECVCPTCGHKIASSDKILVSLETNTINIKGTMLKLSPKVAELAAVLNNAYPKMVSAMDLSIALWGMPDSVDRKLNLAVYASHLRSLLHVFHIDVVSVGGKGYRIRYPTDV